MDSVIVTYINLDQCEEVKDTLLSQIKLLEGVSLGKDKIIALASQDSVIMADMNITLSKTNKDLTKTIKKEKTKSFFKGVWVTALVIAVVEVAAVVIVVVR